MNQSNNKGIGEKFYTMRYSSPQLVFATQDPDDETDKDIIDTQDRFLKLADNIKDKLASSETSNKIENIGRRYGLELEQMASISRVIRNYYFGTVELDQIWEIIFKETGIEEGRAQEIARYVTKDIIEKDAPGTEIVKMILSEALKKYPALGEQLITNSPISPIKPGEEAKKPSLKNWINDYVNIMGREEHTTMERSKYLYGSKSTRNLSVAEKNVLSEMIRALEGGFTVNIDLSRNKVVFGGNGRAAANVRTPIKKSFPVKEENKVPEEIDSRHAPKRAQGGNMELSSNHHFEVEANSGVGSQVNNVSEIARGDQMIKRAQNGNIELSSNHHFGDSEEVETGENIKSVKFDAPHRLPNEK